MNKAIKNLNVLCPKWWNPLFWLVLILAPVFGILGGIACGVFWGFLLGYDKGLEIAAKKLSELLSKLP